MIIGRILLTLTLLGKIAPNYSTFLNCILTIPLLLLSTLIVVLYQNVSDYVNFLGSFSSIFFCCEFLVLCILK